MNKIARVGCRGTVSTIVSLVRYEAYVEAAFIVTSNSCNCALPHA